MRLCLFLIYSCFFLGCEQSIDSSLLEEEQYLLLEKVDTNLTIHGDTLYYRFEKFSGKIFSFFPDTRDTLEISQYSNGLKEGISKKWFSPTQLMEKREFKAGKKHGKQLAYWENGKMRFEFTAVENKYEGTLKEWDYSGLMVHLGNFKNGQEYGVQKMWNQKGEIKSNYLIKNGRRYGLLGTKNCVNVTDSIIDLK